MVFKFKFGFHGLFNAKAIFIEKLLYYLTYICGDKTVYTFPQSFSSKGNEIA